ncbi:uncharacterized protein LOC135154608 [Lytechinus pictus]|uniref:uncharacterized protein LOC135154608 n=1 Tax=Lytechinus pictus TaxID=7653 RepID=UPI0030BA29DE
MWQKDEDGGNDDYDDVDGDDNNGDSDNDGDKGDDDDVDPGGDDNDDGAIDGDDVDGYNDDGDNDGNYKFWQCSESKNLAGEGQLHMSSRERDITTGDHNLGLVGHKVKCYSSILPHLNYAQEHAITPQAAIDNVWKSVNKYTSSVTHKFNTQEHWFYHRDGIHLLDEGSDILFGDFKRTRKVALNGQDFSNVARELRQPQD